MSQFQRIIVFYSICGIANFSPPDKPTSSAQGQRCIAARERRFAAESLLSVTEEELENLQDDLEKSKEDVKLAQLSIELICKEDDDLIEGRVKPSDSSVNERLRSNQPVKMCAWRSLDIAEERLRQAQSKISNEGYDLAVQRQRLRYRVVSLQDEERAEYERFKNTNTDYSENMCSTSSSTPPPPPPPSGGGEDENQRFGHLRFKRTVNEWNPSSLTDSIVQLEIDLESVKKKISHILKFLTSYRVYWRDENIKQVKEYFLIHHTFLFGSVSVSNLDHLIDSCVKKLFPQANCENFFLRELQLSYVEKQLDDFSELYGHLLVTRDSLISTIKILELSQDNCLCN